MTQQTLFLAAIRSMGICEQKKVNSSDRIAEEHRQLKTTAYVLKECLTALEPYLSAAGPLSFQLAAPASSVACPSLAAGMQVRC